MPVIYIHDKTGTVESSWRRAAETINQEAANEAPAIQPVEDMAVPGPAAEPGPAAVQPEVGGGTPQAVPAAPAEITSSPYATMPLADVQAEAQRRGVVAPSGMRAIRCRASLKGKPARS